LAPPTPAMPPTRPDTTKNRHIARVIDHPRKPHVFCNPPAGRIDPDHEARIPATPRLTYGLLQVVDRGAIDRASHLGEENPRPLGSDRGHRARQDGGQKADQQDDAHSPRGNGPHSFLSPFLARAAVRDATSPVMSPAAVVFVTTIMFFSRAISVNVCSSRRRIALGAEPYNMAASRIFSAA